MFALETPRLLLRELTPDDLDDLFALYRDPDVRRYYPDGTRTYEETKREMDMMIEDYTTYGYGLWATIDRQSGRFIGRCGLIPWTVDDQLEVDVAPEVEVAYLLDKNFWGKGLGFEAAQASLRYGFEVAGLPRIVCMMLPENAGSVAIAKKLGMTLFEDTVVQGARVHKFEMKRGDYESRLAAG